MRSLFFALSVGSFLVGFSQRTNPLFFWEAGSSVNYKLSDSWSANTSLGKRSSWENDTDLSGRLRFLELEQFITKKIDQYVKISVGYNYRQLDFENLNKALENRTTVQLVLTHQDKTLRFISRIRAEQRFKDDSFSHRYRYRFSLDAPFSGERLDEKEFFFILSNEFLFEATHSEAHRWDNRMSTSLGYLFTAHVKGLFSTTYRAEDLFGTGNTRLFFNTLLIINLN